MTPGEYHDAGKCLCGHGEGAVRTEAKGKHAMSLHHVVEEWKGPHDGGPESEGPG